MNDKSIWLAAADDAPDVMADRFIEQMEKERFMEDKRARLRQALKSLTAKERELMEAMIYKDKSQSEFAREHGLDKGMVSRRYKSAMKKIKTFF